jgi:hypothetical protein
MYDIPNYEAKLTTGGTFMNLIFNMLALDMVFGDGDLGENMSTGLGTFIAIALGIFGLYKTNNYIDSHLSKYLPLFLLLAIIFTIILPKMRNLKFLAAILVITNILNSYIIMISLYHYLNAGGGGFLALLYVYILEPLGSLCEKSGGILPILNIPISLIGLFFFFVDYTLMPICTIPLIQKVVQKTLIRK